MRYFNVAGPCFKNMHYMIDARERLRGAEPLIEMGQYFVVHAARQSGKTTCLKDLTDRLNQGGRYHCLYCSLETLQGIADEKTGIPQILNRVADSISLYKLPHADRFAKDADTSDFSGVLRVELNKYCALLDRPLVVLFDEADCLSNGTLITFLRQLRNGYIDRDAAPFVHSLALVGMRNIRDYKGRIRPDRETLGSASPFNVVTKALTLADFTREEIAELYAQHTAEQGQVFEPDAVELVWRKTQGQPWLVNAIAREVIFELLDFDYSRPVTAALCEQAIQNIVLRRDVHIDSLLERLKEERVQRVIEPLLLGKFIETATDDYAYVKDLGLIRIDEDGRIGPANPIYAEVMVRTLNASEQERFRQTEETYQLPRYLKDGRIDMNFLLADFQQFWRENSEIWVERFQYKEAAPHLILMAFLQRVVNGGGLILREVAAGKGRLDLCVAYQGGKYPVELKLRHGEKTLPDGLAQLAAYMDTLGETNGWLCIFDRDPARAWDEKIYRKTEPVEGKTIFVFGL
jgi:type II secretory pathway predicted ATPase ExeA